MNNKKKIIKLEITDFLFINFFKIFQGFAHQEINVNCYWNNKQKLIYLKQESIW